MFRGRTPLATVVLVASWLGTTDAQAPVSAAPGPSGARLTIDQAVREALDRNLNLKVERFNVGVAETGVLTASLKPNPIDF